MLITSYHTDKKYNGNGKIWKEANAKNIINKDSELQIELRTEEINPVFPE